MKYFLDTEFSEKPGTIDLISVALVSEDGREFYAEAIEFDKNTANPWVKENVLPHLWTDQNLAYAEAFIIDGGKGGTLFKKQIASGILEFIGNDKPEFWGYYADYDWVVFCWIFGAMIDLPRGWPMYCRDIKQLCDSLGNPELPKSKNMEHHALFDARWNKEAFEYLESLVLE